MNIKSYDGTESSGRATLEWNVRVVLSGEKDI